MVSQTVDARLPSALPRVRRNSAEAPEPHVFSVYGRGIVSAQPADIAEFRAASLCWPSHLRSTAVPILRAGRITDSRLADADTRGLAESARTASPRRFPPLAPRSACD